MCCREVISCLPYPFWPSSLPPLTQQYQNVPALFNLRLHRCLFQSNDYPPPPPFQNMKQISRAILRRFLQFEDTSCFREKKETRKTKWFTGCSDEYCFARSRQKLCQL
ncbi:hypothetical protein AVEN_275045-1 [Araneus ventricosus]|uniref:Uncharacterized protein n=1 Tax=Araneus ventricosus TaxID=182803 RepID=A0A4Y2EVF7_ARAVE|nr:hypothetical protein AVEN_275045-1 [Araneus ventricosus]